MWTTIVLLVSIYVLYRILRKKRINIPGPFQWPVFGNALSLGDEGHIWFGKMAKRYGDIFLIKLGSYDVVVLNSFDVIHEALVQQSKAFSGRPNWPSFKYISQGKGVVFNSSITLGEKWKTMKLTLVRYLNRFIQNNENIKKLNNDVIREAVEMIQFLRKHNAEMKNMKPSSSSVPKSDEGHATENIINLASANIACMAVFGHRYNHDSDEFKQLIGMNRVFGKVLVPASRVDTTPWMETIPHFKSIMELFRKNRRTMSNWVKSRCNYFS